MLMTPTRPTRAKNAARRCARLTKPSPNTSACIAVTWTRRTGRSAASSPATRAKTTRTPDLRGTTVAVLPLTRFPMPPADWAAARAAMLLDPAVANLNTGSFGPLSRVVFERVTALRLRLAEEPMDFLVRRVPDLLWAARVALAEFLHTTPARLVFTTNVSASINLVASSLELASPGEILLTDHEYGAMHWCWERAARRMGLTLRTFA